MCAQLLPVKSFVYVILESTVEEIEALHGKLYHFGKGPITVLYFLRQFLDICRIEDELSSD